MAGSSGRREARDGDARHAFAPARWRRRALRLFWGYAALLLVAGVVLVATITPANAGYPALFFATVLAVASVPVWILSLTFGAIALLRREPDPLAVLVVVVLCSALLWVAAPIAYRVARAVAGA